MNFGVSGGGFGLIGLFIVFGAAMLAFTVIVAVVVRIVRGRDDGPAPPAGSARPEAEDDYIL